MVNVKIINEILKHMFEERYKWSIIIEKQITYEK